MTQQPVASSNMAVTAAGGIPGMYGQQQPQSQMQQLNTNPSFGSNGFGSPQPQTAFKPAAATMAMAPITSTGFNQQSPSPATTAAVQPAPAPAPAPVVKELLPDTEGIILLNQVITSVTAAANAAEKRQMAMVNDAFNLLRKRASEGGVAPDILQKVHQFANDIATRNFTSASAIQAVSQSINIKLCIHIYYLFLICDDYVML